MKYAETTLEWKRRPLELEDRAILDRYLERLEERAAGGGAGTTGGGAGPSASAAVRHFDLVYFYATHYNYYYPPSYERFTPALGPDFSAEDLALAERREELFNRYRNAVVYLDSLFGDALDRLEASGRLERTIVLVTGDHGQELFERGRFGHSMALNDYQVRVPLVLHIPGGRAREIRYRVTSHADVAPTLLAAIGADLDLERLFTGKDLLAYDPARDDAIVASQRTTGSPVEFALVEPGRKVYFANRAEDVTIGLATALDDEPLPPLDEAETRRIAARLLAEKRHFGAAAKLSLDPTATDLEGSR